MLTRKQQQSYDFIRAYLAEHGYAPSLEEISHALGSRSRTTAFNHVRELAAAGLIRLVEGRRRNIELVEEAQSVPSATTLPLAGKIAAGRPIEALEDQDSIDLSQFFMGPDRFVLRVEGESMIEAGILDGDMVIVQRQDHAAPGDIVVALIDQYEATLKYIDYNEDGSIRLIPANRDLAVMQYPAERIAIQGIVVGQMRSYE